MNEIIDEMLEIKDLIAQHKFEIKRLETREELLNVKLITLLKQKNVDEMILPNCRFGFVKKSRTAFDQALFSKENHDLFEKYKITKEKEDFIFKVGGK